MSLMACVVKIDRKGKQESFLVEAEKFVIGRAPDCDFVIPDPQISRQHLGVLLKDGEIFVKDLGSANGSFLGEEKIPTDKVVRHNEGEKLRLGTTDIYVELSIVDKKIDEKSIAASNSIPADQKSQVSQVIEQAKARSRTLHEEYEQLVENARSQSLKESQAIIEEAQLRAREMKAQAESVSSRVVNEAKAKEVEILAQARVQQSQIVDGAKTQAIEEGNKARLAIENKAKDQAFELKRQAEIALNEANDKVSAQLKSIEEQGKSIIKEAEAKAQAQARDAELKVMSIHAEADTKLRQATADADNIIAKAKTEAERIIAERTEKADMEAKLLAEATVAAVKRDMRDEVDKAKLTAEKLTSDAKVEFEGMVRKAQLEADSLTEKARTDFEQNIAKAKSEAEKIVSAAMSDSATNRRAAEEAETRRALADSQARELIAAAQKKVDDITKQAEVETSKLRETTEKYVAELRQETEQKTALKIKEADRAAEDITFKAKVSADEMTKQAGLFFATKKTEAEAAAQKILQDVQAQVDRLYLGFDQKKKDEFERLQKETEQVRFRMEQEQKSTLHRLEMDHQSKVQLFDEECNIRRKQIELESKHELELLEENKAERNKYAKEIEQMRTLHETLAADTKAKQIEAKTMEVAHSNIKTNFESANARLAAITSKADELEKQAKLFAAQKETLVTELHELRRNIDADKSNSEKEIYDHRLKLEVEMNEIRTKEAQEIEKRRYAEIAKIDEMKRQASEKIIQNKEVFRMKLAEKIEDRLLGYARECGISLDLTEMHAKVTSLVDSSINEQTYELSASHEADIKRQVTDETKKRQGTVKKWTWAIVGTAAAGLAFFIYKGGDINSFLLGKNARGETGAQEFTRIIQEKRAAKKFDPAQSDYMKPNYTDNVLYTRNYVSTYNDQALQEKWIHELNAMFTRDFGLDDDAIVKFVALESTLVQTLQQEKDGIVSDFAQVGIDKMRKIENDTVAQMRVIVKNNNNLNKVQNYAERFWKDALQERRPAGSF